jgi:tetratricopeptide (TPR) repeat protein
VLLWFGAFAIVRLVESARRRARGRSFPPVGVPAALLLPLLIAATHLRTPLLEAQSLKRVDYLNFGTLYRNRGEPEKARKLLERSLAIDPAYAPAYLGLAAVHESLGNEMEAARLGAMARRLRSPEEPRNSRTDDLADRLLAAGRVYQTGDYPAAAHLFEELRVEAAAAGDTALLLGTTNNLGLCRYQQGDLEGAGSVFAGLIRDHPEYVKPYNNLAKVREAQGRIAEARELYRQALARDPENPVARKELVRLPGPGP